MCALSGRTTVWMEDPNLYPVMKEDEEKIVKCPYCNSEVTFSVSKCPNCGAVMPDGKDSCVEGSKP